MKEILLKLYTIWVLLIFSVFMIILLPLIVLPVAIHDKLGILTVYAIKLWAWIFSQLNFIHYKVINRKHVKASKSYIYTCNHTSFLDSPGIALAIPGQFRALAKKELLKIPVFGLIVRVFTIVVDRSSPESRKESLSRLKEKLAKGVSILIFPEGTQNRTEELLQPFYSGAFRTAIETNTPIMPMVVLNAGRLMPPGGISVRPGKIKVVFGEEIDTSDYAMDRIEELKIKTFERMRELILAHS